MRTNVITCSITSVVFSLGVALTFICCAPSRPSLTHTIEVLERGLPHQRLEAARELASRGKIAVWPLRKALHDPDFSVRAQAANSLGRIGPAAREAVPELEALVRDDYNYVAIQAKEALELIRLGFRTAPIEDRGRRRERDKGFYRGRTSPADEWTVP